MASKAGALACVSLAAALAGCAGGPETEVPPERWPLLRSGLETLAEEGALEPRQVRPLAVTLVGLDPPLAGPERDLARAVALDLARGIAKRRSWGVRRDELSLDLRLAARLLPLAGEERLSAADLAPLVEEVLIQRAPRGIEALLEAWVDLRLPRTAAAAEAVVRGAGARFPDEGLLEALLVRGFRLEDATLKAYAERSLERRYDAQDVIFVIERTGGDPSLRARLPELAERLLDAALTPGPLARDAALRRRLFRNAVLALDAAHRSGEPLPEALFERALREAAQDDALAVDDLARAFSLYGRRADEIVERRLDRLRGARATRDALAETLAATALLLEAVHPRAEEALLLARRILERPPGLDETIGARPPAGRRYDPDAVRRLVEEVAPSLAASFRARLYLDLVTALVREQGEPALAARLEGMALARR